MNTQKNTNIRNIFLGLALCAMVLFMFTSTGKDLLENGYRLFAPTVAQSAIMPMENDSSIFQKALETEIYLPQEVDLNAGSDFIPQLEQAGKLEGSDITAMLNGGGLQCNFRDHMAGAVALNNCGSI